MDPGSTLRLISDILVVVQQSVFNLLAYAIQLQLIRDKDSEHARNFDAQKQSTDTIEISLVWFNDQITKPLADEADIEKLLIEIETHLSLFDSTADSRVNVDVSNCFASYNCTSSRKAILFSGERLNTVDGGSRYIFNDPPAPDAPGYHQIDFTFRRSDSRISDEAGLGSFLCNTTGAKVLEFTFELYFEDRTPTAGMRGAPVDFGLELIETNDDDTSVTLITTLDRRSIASGGTGGELGISLIGVAMHDIKPGVKTISARLTTFVESWDARNFQLLYCTPYAPFFRCKMSY